LSWLLKRMGITPDQIAAYLIDGIKKMSNNDIKQLAEFVARLCISDREACIKIMKTSYTVYSVCKNVLTPGVEAEQRGGEQGEEEEADE